MPPCECLHVIKNILFLGVLLHWVKELLSSYLSGRTCLSRINMKNPTYLFFFFPIQTYTLCIQNKWQAYLYWFTILSRLTSLISFGCILQTAEKSPLARAVSLLKCSVLTAIGQAFMATAGRLKAVKNHSALYHHLCKGYLLICHKYLSYFKIRENISLYFSLFLNEKLPIALAFAG